ncbi:hypothetical protein MC885_002477 [Smutsia gigantea]|nr:hypothetical protein MC885_002477 [Smutsia gigantea]
MHGGEKGGAHLHMLGVAWLSLASSHHVSPSLARHLQSRQLRPPTSSLRNVFPTENLTWFIDGSFPQGEEKKTLVTNLVLISPVEIYISNEEKKGKHGFLECKSVLTKVYDNKLAHSDNLTIWCMALYPAPRNEVWTVLSKKISFSLCELSI